MLIKSRKTSGGKMIFVATSSFEEKDAVKAAGFWWHPGNGMCGRDNCQACDLGIGKTWWTPFPEKAVRLIDHADEETKAILKNTTDSIEASKAASAPAENIPVPAGLAYLPFQAAGIKYASERPATLIADEMGLGKTIQAIGVMNVLKPTSVLVICPASLRINWRREMTKWLVEKHTIYVVESGYPIPKEASFIVCNYDRLKNSTFEALMTRSWDLVVLDEAHYVKNPKAARSKALLGVAAHKDKKTGELIPAVEGILDRCKYKLFLTGTPILNKPIELQPILAKISPREFGSFFGFAKRYCNATQNKYGWDFSGASHLDELQTRLRANYMVRRLKKDVLTELPAKRRQVIEIPVEGSDLKKALKAEQEAWNAHESALDELSEAASMAEALDDQEAYKDIVAKLQERSKVAFEDMSGARRALGLAKIPAVIDHISSVLESGVEKLIVFCHHLDVLDAMKMALGDQAVTLSGSTSPEDRQAAVDRFQNDPTCKVFIGTIKAAGVGLTLTAASHVIFVELDWVPANVTQAEDRAHRIGQMESVLIQHLVVNGSIDARMAHILVKKQEIADAALDNDTTIFVPVAKEKRQGKRQGKRHYPKASSEAREAIAVGIQLLAATCDGAFVKDECGFNKIDTRFGRELAGRSTMRELTDGELWAAAKLCVKYHRQLVPETVALSKELLSQETKEP